MPRATSRAQAWLSGSGQSPVVSEEDPHVQDVTATNFPRSQTTTERGAGRCGKLWGTTGCRGQPLGSDISRGRCRPDIAKRYPSKHGHAFAYVFAGSGTFRNASDPREIKTDRLGSAPDVAEETGNRSLILFDRGDEVTVQAGEMGIRFLLVSGKPIEEPVAWYGPIVMNTEAELRQAVSEIQEGTFIKHP